MIATTTITATCTSSEISMVVGLRVPTLWPVSTKLCSNMSLLPSGPGSAPAPLAFDRCLAVRLLRPPRRCGCLHRALAPIAPLDIRHHHGCGHRDGGVGSHQ